MFVPPAVMICQRFQRVQGFAGWRGLSSLSKPLPMENYWLSAALRSD